MLYALLTLATQLMNVFMEQQPNATKEDVARRERAMESCLKLTEIVNTNMGKLYNPSSLGADDN